MQAFIFHGTQSHPQKNWFSWMKGKLEPHNVNVFIPALPTPEDQSVSSWFKALMDQCPPIDEDTLLIGHSCGANFILHILERLERPVFYTALVGCVIHEIGDTEIDTLNKSFVNHPYEWGKIRKNAGKISIFHGDDDPYVPLDQPLELARALNIPLTIIPGGGHLNEDAGYTDFLLLYEDIRQHIEK